MANSGPIQNPLLPQLGQIKIQPKPQPKPEDSHEIHKDVIILQKPAENEAYTDILTTIRVANKDLTPDPNTSEVPVEFVAVRKTPNLADVKPSYIGEPVPMTAAPEGQVNIPTYMQADKADVDSGEFQKWQIGVIKPGEVVAPADLVAPDKSALLDEFTVRDSAPTDSLAFNLPLPTLKNWKPGIAKVPITRDQVLGMVDGTMEFAPLIASATIATGTGAGFGAYTGAVTGLVTAYKGLQSWVQVGRSQSRVDGTARKQNAVDLPMAIDPKTGKVIETKISKSVRDLDVDLKVGARDAVGKILKGGVLAAAGATALTGSALAPWLAVGSIVVGTGFDGVSTKDKLALNKTKTEELRALQNEGKTTYLEEVPVKGYVYQDDKVVVDDNGNPFTQVISSKKVEMPIKDRLDQLEAERTQLQLSPLQSLGMVAAPAVSVLTGASMMAAGAVVGPFMTTTMAVADGRMAYKLMKRRDELQSLKDAGQTTIKMQVPVYGDDSINNKLAGRGAGLVQQRGNITGSREIEVPIDGQLKEINKQIAGATTQGSIKLGLGAGMAAVTLGGLPWVAGLGAIALPAGTIAYNTLRDLQPLKEQRDHLRELQAKGETTFKQPVPVGDKYGNLAGFQDVEVPIADQLKALDTTIGKGHWKATAAATTGLTALGVSAAAIAGAPVAAIGLGAAAALVAVPAAAAFVFMPEQTSQFFSNAWDGIKSFGHRVADAIRSLWPFGEKEETNLSPAQQQLNELHGEFKAVDKKAAKQLQEVTRELVTCKDENRRTELQAQYSETLAVFQEKSPELAAKWPAAVGNLQQEVVAQQQAELAKEQIAALEPKVEALRNSVSEQDRVGLELESQRQLLPLIQSPALKGVADSLGMSQEDALQIGQSLLLQGLKGDSSELELLKFKAAAGDEDAIKKQQFLGALTQAVAEAAKPVPLTDDQVRIAVGQDPVLQGILGSPDCDKFVQGLQLTKEDVDSSLQAWATLQLRKDPSGLQALEEAAQSDPKSKAKLEFLGAFVNTYNQAIAAQQQMAQAAGTAPDVSGQPTA